MEINLKDYEKDGAEGIEAYINDCVSRRVILLNDELEEIKYSNDSLRARLNGGTDGSFADQTVDLRSRIGTFLIDNRALNGYIYDIQRMMIGVVVLVADRQPENTRYVAIHPDFDAIEEDAKPGEYEYIINRPADGHVTGGWQRID